MKRLLLLLLLILFIPNVYAEEDTIERIDVKLVKCDSISNVWIKENKDVKRISLLAFDMGDGELNKEIDNYFCSLLTNASKLSIEYDVDTKDNYNRDLVYLYADDNLVQEDLISKGYGQVNYVKNNYRYIELLCGTQKNAIIEKSGIWNYSGIKEEYCNSGITINMSKDEIKKELKAENKFDTKILYTLIFFNSGVLLLILLLRKRNV